MTNEAYITRQYYSEKPAQSEALCLSMLVSQNSFMYAISTNNFKNVVELCHIEITHVANASFDITEKIAFLVNNNLLHQKKFDKVNVSFLNNDFTMIPEAYSENADIKSLLNFSTGNTALTRSLKHSLKNINFCFAVNQELINFFERTFPNVSIRHEGAVNIALFFSQHSLLNSNLYLNVGDGYMELFAKDRNELVFYNVFNFENNEDILYYLLFTMEQFQLNPLHVKLTVAAQRATENDLIKTIKKYIKNVSFCVTDPSVRLNGELTQLPYHYYFTLLNQHLCEL